VWLFQNDEPGEELRCVAGSRRLKKRGLDGSYEVLNYITHRRGHPPDGTTRETS